MESIQIGKLKSEFSSILQQVEQNGETFIIEYGKKHKKIAMLVPYSEAYANKQNRNFGIMEGKGSYSLNDDFVMSEEDLLG
jgi:antitoxin (DNA-binding transcriptional repressor) of toxin-antitoxin stability system